MLGHPDQTRKILLISSQNEAITRDERSHVQLQISLLTFGLLHNTLGIHGQRWKHRLIHLWWCVLYYRSSLIYFKFSFAIIDVTFTNVIFFNDCHFCSQMSPNLFKNVTRVHKCHPQPIHKCHSCSQMSPPAHPQMSLLFTNVTPSPSTNVTLVHKCHPQSIHKCHSCSQMSLLFTNVTPPCWQKSPPFYL